MKNIYLAGGLFNAGERLHLLVLENALKKLGYNVILPQREALKYQSDGKFDLDALVADCKKSAMDSRNIFVGCMDGADTDSGTAVEYGMAIASVGKAVIYRTDFRTALDKEVGLNGMFNAKETRFIYHPCYLTELSEIDSFYEELSDKIHKAIESL